MRVKTISRVPELVQRGRVRDLDKVKRNLDPNMHPFERAREYKRALNAVKLDRVFAKPFLDALSGHSDTVQCMTRHANVLNTVISGSCDGEIRMWDLSLRRCIRQLAAHDGFVRGLAMGSQGDYLVSCGDDKTVKLWDLKNESDNPSEPLATFMGQAAFTCVDHHWTNDMFCTTGVTCDLWNSNRSTPIHTFGWGTESIFHAKFNRVEHNILATCGTDRSLVLYDVRAASPLRKLVMGMKINALCWNPVEAFNFTVASEDCNLYTFDMRKLNHARTVHKDHLDAVLAVDYSPTGREFVSGSYDRTLRVFNEGAGRSREVYHTKRMQRIMCVSFSGDARFVLSGSDDMNVRLWKAQASQPTHTLMPREKQRLRYLSTLKKRFQHLPEIRRIARSRHLPKALHNKQRELKIREASHRRKVDNIIKHSKAGAVQVESERDLHIVSVQE
eukprot:gnl/Trimastix_PCT/1053.p1 GENE.gnl/Trimastix_PCT/1053~~gnl/Trimastix_PCT/1053.p1  ORF type:complete len:445 (+),score=98.69 gnl/Trimastix_PCT/1053:58-1392(+)